MIEYYVALLGAPECAHQIGTSSLIRDEIVNRVEHLNQTNVDTDEDRYFVAHREVDFEESTPSWGVTLAIAVVAAILMVGLLLIDQWVPYQ